jgi:hypothetical protein
MKNRKRSTILWVILLAFMLGGMSFAQNSSSGELTGTVLDPTNAVLPGAAVEVANIQTGQVIHTTTNGKGIYAVTSVPLGQYTITFTKQGFSSFIREGFTIYVGTFTVDATLHPGDVGQQVTVNAQTPLLETDSSEQSTTLDTQAVESMPIVGSDWRTLDGVLPGVNGGGNQQASGQYVGYNGTQGNSVAWLLDGSGAVLPHDYNPSQVYPPVDAVQEVNASTSNFSAQYGNGLAIINVITKNGTNKIHGSLFEMIQNDAVEARNYFAQSATPLRWNQFGGSIGGPILRDKLFLFFSYMENPAVSTQPSFYTFPTAAMRAGDFSDPQFPTIYDPKSLATVNGVATRTPLPGNKITNIDPVAQKIQNFFPMPNNLGSGGNAIYNNYYIGLKSFETNRWYQGRVDFQINDNNRLSSSILVTPQNRPSPDPRCPLNCTNGIFRDQAGQISETATISPSMVNEARVGYVREYVGEVSPSVGQGYPDQLGLINAPADIFPTINVTGSFSTELDGGINALQAQLSSQYSDVLTLVRGKHVVKLGGEYDRSYQNLRNWGDISSGNFNFSGIATRNPADAASTGLGYADLLFGLPASWNVTEYAETGSHINNVAAFVQDDYKVRTNLTLNLGLRYQYLGSWFVKGNQFGTFDPNVLNPATHTAGAMVFGGQMGRNTIQNAAPYSFEPRIGFAYAIGNHWSLRGSYGLFDMVRSADPYANNFLGTGFNIQGSLTSTDNINPVFRLGVTDASGAGYPQGPPVPTKPTLGALTPDLLNGQNVFYMPVNVPIQYVQEAFLNLQRELPGSILLSGSYVFTKGTHLGFQRDINQVPEALLQAGNTQPFRPYPQFNSITASYWDGWSNYNALQLQAVKRVSAGLLFTLNYSYSKTMDTGTGGGNTSAVDTYQRSYDTAANYGRSLLDMTQLFNGLVSYDLPFGRGRQFLNQNNLANYLIGGWRLGSFFQLHSGIPFTPVMGTANLSNSLAGAWFPNLTGKTTLAHPSINEYFNVSSFQQPAPYTFGNSGRNILRGPGWEDVDMNLAKTFPIPRLGEASGLELRLDTFNVLNHPNFGQPNANIGTSGAGVISSASASRNLQLTMRLKF